MRRSLWTAAAAMTAVLAVAGCSPSRSPQGSQETAGSSSGQSQYDIGPRAGSQPADAALAAEGEKLFQSKACSACHAFGKKVTGPDLAGVSMRRTAEWMKNQILRPNEMTKSDPIARDLFAKHALQMPNQGLTEEEAKAVIEYFKQRDQQAGLRPEAAQ